MDKQAYILEQLKQLGVAYELVAHPAAFTMQDMEDFGLTKKGLVAKNLFLRDNKGKRHFLVVVAGDKRVDLKTLGAQMGDRFSFASEDRLQKHLNLEKGAVTPLGVLMNEDKAVRVLLDKDLEGEPRIGVHPGVNTATVFISFEDLARVIDAHGNPRGMVELPAGGE